MNEAIIAIRTRLGYCLRFFKNKFEIKEEKNQYSRQTCRSDKAAWEENQIAGPGTIRQADKWSNPTCGQEDKETT